MPLSTLGSARAVFVVELVYSFSRCL